MNQPTRPHLTTGSAQAQICAESCAFFYGDRTPTPEDIDWWIGMFGCARHTPCTFCKTGGC